MGKINQRFSILIKVSISMNNPLGVAKSEKERGGFILFLVFGAFENHYHFLNLLLLLVSLLLKMGREMHAFVVLLSKTNLLPACQDRSTPERHYFQ